MSPTADMTRPIKFKIEKKHSDTIFAQCENGDLQSASECFFLWLREVKDGWQNSC